MKKLHILYRLDSLMSILTEKNQQIFFANRSRYWHVATYRIKEIDIGAFVNTLEIKINEQ